MEKKSKYQLEREQNILKMREKLGFNYNPNAIIQENDLVDNQPKAKASIRKRRNSDPTFQANISSPPQKRQSFRIAKKKPLYDDKDLINDDDDNDLSDHDPDECIEDYVKTLQKVVYPSKKRTSSSSCHPIVDGFRVREFSQEEIDNIAKSSRDKKRSRGSGTTCHQCRQHTLDTKSFCHNSQCIGINGQLCGPCLLGRYGEFVETTIKDPKWICPFCRGICNCSFCRRRNGRLPTGILAHVANKQGFKSVHHLLSLSRNDDDDDDDEDKKNEDLSVVESKNENDLESVGKKDVEAVKQNGIKDKVEKMVVDDDGREINNGNGKDAREDDKINNFPIIVVSEAKKNLETVKQESIKDDDNAEEERGGSLIIKGEKIIAIEKDLGSENETVKQEGIQVEIEEMVDDDNIEKEKGGIVIFKGKEDGEDDKITNDNKEDLGSEAKKNLEPVKQESINDEMEDDNDTREERGGSLIIKGENINIVIEKEETVKEEFIKDEIEKMVVDDDVKQISDIFPGKKISNENDDGEGRKLNNGDEKDIGSETNKNVETVQQEGINNEVEKIVEDDAEEDKNNEEIDTDTDKHEGKENETAQNSSKKKKKRSKGNGNGVLKSIEEKMNAVKDEGSKDSSSVPKALDNNMNKEKITVDEKSRKRNVPWNDFTRKGEEYLLGFDANLNPVMRRY